MIPEGVYRRLPLAINLESTSVVKFSWFFMHCSVDDRKSSRVFIGWFFPYTKKFTWSDYTSKKWELLLFGLSRKKSAIQWHMYVVVRLTTNVGFVLTYKIHHSFTFMKIFLHLFNAYLFLHKYNIIFYIFYVLDFGCYKIWYNIWHCTLHKFTYILNERFAEIQFCITCDLFFFNPTLLVLLLS